MPPRKTKSFCLRAPIPAQLEAILADYPGGQLLSEALQNAEDSGARSFELTLDLRRHDGIDEQLSGPAFVISDDGRSVLLSPLCAHWPPHSFTKNLNSVPHILHTVSHWCH